MPDYYSLSHPVDPTVDCVFKSIFGSDENRFILIDLLNNVLELPRTHQVSDVTIKDPYGSKGFLSDKQVIVDIHAVDEAGIHYQFEVQLQTQPALRNRILYNWSKLYHTQLETAEDYSKLTPVVSIWFLRDNLIRQSSEFHHHFGVYDKKHALELSRHLAIHTIELAKWDFEKRGGEDPFHYLEGKDLWLYFLKETKNRSQLPKSVKSEPLKAAMEVLNRFSDSQENYLRYQRRLDLIRQESTRIHYLELAKKEAQEYSEQIQTLSKEAEALSEEKQALSEEKQALSEEKQALSEEKQVLSEEKQVLSEEKQALSEEKQVLSEEVIRLKKLLHQSGIAYES